MLVEIRDLTKTYVTGNVEVGALQGIDLTIAEGEFVAIMGPSGSGKTTFMNMLGCLDRPTSGTYSLASKHVEDLPDDQLAAIRNTQMGFVFQDYSLLQRSSALHNVELPLLYERVPLVRQTERRLDRRSRALAALQRMGVADRAAHRPTELSGGQQQRVAIARALVTEPSLILADEPTGNLDSHTGADVMSVFRQLNDQGITIVLVTHDEHVASYAKRLVTFLDGKVLSDQAVVNNALNGEGEGTEV